MPADTSCPACHWSVAMNRPAFPAAWWGFVAALTTAVLATVSVAAGEESPPAAAAGTSVPASPGVAAPAPTAVQWSYQPVKSQTIPEVHEKKWVRTPIDAFVLARLETSKLEPSA